MKKRHVVYLVVAFLCSVAVFIVLINYMNEAITKWNLINSVSTDREIINTYIAPIVSRTIYCVLALSAIVLLILLGIGQRKQIIDAFKKNPEAKKAMLEEAKQKELLIKQQKIEKLEKQLEELKKENTR